MTRPPAARRHRTPLLLAAAAVLLAPLAALTAAPASATPTTSTAATAATTSAMVTTATSTAYAGTVTLREGSRGPRVRDLQARLAQLDWFHRAPTGYFGPVTARAVRGFQAKRGFRVTGVADARTLDRLRSMTRRPTAAELAGRTNQAGALDRRCRTGRVICVDKTTRTVRWVVDGRVLQTLDARFGGRSTPTREGVFAVQRKSRHHVSSIYGTPMPYAMFFSGGQAVHYSPDFAAVGYAGASHGCVNVRDRAGVARLFDRVRLGDRVVVSWS